MPNTPRRDPKACPVCGRPEAAAHRPFCGQGCRDRDLLAWLDGGYRVPGQAVGEDENGGDALDSPLPPPL